MTEDVLEPLYDAVVRGDSVCWDEELADVSPDSDAARILRNLQRLVEFDLANQRAWCEVHDDLPFAKWRHLRIVGRLGSGTYGEVFRARDDVLDQVVALKLYHELDDDQDRRTGVLAEARRLARVRHDNVVRVHGIEMDRGRVGFWMEFVEGDALQQILEREGPLDATQVAHIGIALARALTAAHAAGVLHGDIKPTNVLCEQGGRVVLLDFGAGRSAIPRNSGDLHRVGTPLFMAPETLVDGTFDERSDVYSLGALLYHTLTGEYPVDGASLEDVVEAQRNRLSPPVGGVPGPRSLSDLRPGLPRGLVAAIDRCLLPDPDARFGMASQLESALADVVKSRRSISRIGTVGIAVATVALAAGLYWNAMQPPGMSGNPSLVLAGFSLATGQSDTLLAGSLTTLVRAGLFEARPIRVVSTSRVLELRRKDGNPHNPIRRDAALEVARRADAEMALVGQVGCDGDGAWVSWEVVDAASGKARAQGRAGAMSRAAIADIVVGDVVGEIARLIGGTSMGSLLSTGAIVSGSDSALVEYQRALVASERSQPGALAHLQRAVTIDSNFALAHLGLAEEGPGRPIESARLHAEHAWRARSRLGLRDRLTAEAMREGLRGNVEGEVATQREILTRWPDDFDATVMSLRTLFKNRRYDEALEVATGGLAHYPDNEALAFRRVSALRAMERNEEALAGARALVLRLPTDDVAWSHLGFVFLDAGLPDSASIAFETAKRHGNQPGTYLGELARCEFARGNVDRAIALQESAFAYPAVPSGRRAQFLPDYRNTVDYYWATGRFQRCLNGLDEALVDAGTQTKRVILSYRAHILVDSGRFADAFVQWREWKDRSDLNLRDAWEIEAWRTYALAGADSLAAARASAMKLFDRSLWWYSIYRARAYLQLADIEVREGNPDSALAHLALAERGGLPPGSSFGWTRTLIRARALALRGNHSEAVAQCDAVIRQLGGLATAWYERGRIKEEMGERDAARADYERFLALYAHADANAPLLRTVRDRWKHLN